MILRKVRKKTLWRGVKGRKKRVREMEKERVKQRIIEAMHPVQTVENATYI
jgi:hypothetical protein